MDVVERIKGWLVSATEDARKRSLRNTDFVGELLLRHPEMFHKSPDTIFHKSLPILVKHEYLQSQTIRKDTTKVSICKTLCLKIKRSAMCFALQRRNLRPQTPAAS